MGGNSLVTLSRVRAGTSDGVLLEPWKETKGQRHPHDCTRGQEWRLEWKPYLPFPSLPLSLLHGTPSAFFESFI